MTGFRRYDHVERLGHDSVEGIAAGAVYVFPKLDGANASVWIDSTRPEGDRLCFGSRNLDITDRADGLFGFAEWVRNQAALAFAAKFIERPSCIIYGEWLVPHTLKTYRDEAWRRFWVFDVWDREQHKYLSYDDYATWLKATFSVVPPLATWNNPSEEQLRREVANNTYMIQDGAGLGEGIVIKNYDWQNRFGRQPWAKIVRNEFKEENRRAFGTPEKGGEFQVEAAIAEEWVTAALVEKTRAKVRLALMARHGVSAVGPDIASDRAIEEQFRDELIPQLLQCIYQELVTEELWAAVKKHKDPTINFKKLRRYTIERTKKFAEDLF